MDDPLEGIREKLKRSDECISNLDREIRAFFDQSLYPVIPNKDEETFKEAVDYHRRRDIPLRFSVLAGEIVHHLRSCLNHLAWLLSDPCYRTCCRRSIEFPVFERKPTNKEQSGYDRKVAGMSDHARQLILSRQPYVLHPGGDAHEDPLAVLHDLDRLDKHVALAFAFFITKARWRSSVLEAIQAHRKTKSAQTLAEYERAVKEDVEIAPHIAFKDFGTSEASPVCVLLRQISCMCRDIIEELRGEIV